MTSKCAKDIVRYLMRPKAGIYGRVPGNTGAFQVKQMLDGRLRRAEGKSLLTNVYTYVYTMSGGY